MRRYQPRTRETLAMFKLSNFNYSPAIVVTKREQ